MVIDHLSNAHRYTALHPLFAAAFEYLKNFDPNTPDGKYELDGNRLFAMVQRYDTAPASEKAWESHQVYADIQFVVSGREKMLWAPVGELTPKDGYNAERDMEKYAEEPPHHGAANLVSGELFTMYFPQDGHKPAVMVDQPEPVLKVIMKIRLEQ